MTHYYVEMLHRHLSSFTSRGLVMSYNQRVYDTPCFSNISTLFGVDSRDKTITHVIPLKRTGTLIDVSTHYTHAHTLNTLHTHSPHTHIILYTPHTCTHLIHTHAQTLHTYIHSHTHTHAQTHTHSHTLPHTRKHTHTHSTSHMHTLQHTHVHQNAHARKIQEHLFVINVLTLKGKQNH